MLLEVFCEFEQFLGVASETRELGKHQPFDVPAFDVEEHPLGLGVILDRLAAHPREIVKLAHLPAFGLSIGAGANLVVLRTVTLGLVIGGDAYPNADRKFLGKIAVGFHGQTI